jgi:hypothetical protein
MPSHGASPVTCPSHPLCATALTECGVCGVQDLQDEGESPSDHTLYYLGITHFALIESGIPTQIQSEDDRVSHSHTHSLLVET